MQYLYLIQCQEFYKIGIANDVQSRLAQLSTGNPFELKVLAVYGFANAEPVERSIHQKFANSRRRGEWFELSVGDLDHVRKICELLGGQWEMYESWQEVDEEEIEEAEVLAQPTEGGKWDYAAMFTDGWRMERTTNGRHVGEGSRYWCWRKGTASRGKKYIYGGLLSDLPHAIEEMRRMYAPQEEG